MSNGISMERVEEIMRENGLSDLSRVGLYGLTYKEDVDDVRESPTLQLLECMRRHLAPPLLCYDPMVKKEIARRQARTLEEFLEAVDLVVVMVGHREIVQNSGLLKGKIVLDTRKCLTGMQAYSL